jgi:hypothetical protein
MIIGLTDKPQIRRDGKIRAGTGKNSGGLKNTEYFHMRDCPQLIAHLGDQPKEIYFTFHADTPNEIAKIDLRWYNATELLCQSMHNTADKSRPIGQWAAYKGLQDAEGCTQEAYPMIARSRKRACNYKQCRQYMTGDCGEHLFLNVMVPQYSMSSIFTLDSTSIEAILNILGLFEKVGTQFGGKFSGEIFRMYKKQIDTNFYNTASGKTQKGKQWVVHFEHVPFHQYIEKFGGVISPENLAALERLRSQTGLRTYSVYAGASLAALAAPAAVPAIGFDGLDGEDAQPAISGGHPATSAFVSDEEALLERANHAALTPLFEELSRLVGVENTETNRLKTARAIKSVEELVVYLKAKISEARKRQAVEETPSVVVSSAPKVDSVLGADSPLF